MNPLANLLYRLNRARWFVTRPLTVGVRLILVQEGRVLLVKHTYQPHWYLPGGGAQRGETLEEAARREAGEELGATLGELRLFGVYSNFYEYKSDHVAVFVCDELTLSGKTDREIERYAFFAPEAIPADASPGTRRRLQEYIQESGAPFASRW